MIQKRAKDQRIKVPVNEILAGISSISSNVGWRYLDRPCGMRISLRE